MSGRVFCSLAKPELNFNRRKLNLNKRKIISLINSKYAKCNIKFDTLNKGSTQSKTNWHKLQERLTCKNYEYSDQVPTTQYC